jgi:hypothetical protein
MREIPYKSLEPGQTYYIESGMGSWISGSGKQIGKFSNIEDYQRTPFAKFTNLRDLPNAKIPSGFGTSTENRFSTSITRFYLPEADDIMSRTRQRALEASINAKSTEPSSSDGPRDALYGMGEDIAKGWFSPSRIQPPSVGGKRRSKRRHVKKRHSRKRRQSRRKN